MLNTVLIIHVAGETIRNVIVQGIDIQVNDSLCACIESVDTNVDVLVVRVTADIAELISDNETCAHSVRIKLLRGTFVKNCNFSD
jgi:hypothetical protein